MAKLDREELGALLSAYVDGEVTAQEASFAERLIAEDEGARQLMDRLSRSAQLASSLPRHPAPDSILDDLNLQMERAELLGQPDESPVIGGERRMTIPRWLSVAAMIGMAIVGGWWVTVGSLRRDGAPLAERVALGPDSPGELGSKDERSAARRSQVPSAPALHAGERPKKVRGRGGTSQVDADAPAVPARGTPPDSLLAKASLDQKLAAALPVTSLRTHRFENENLQVQIPVRKPADAEAVMHLLTTRLGLEHVVDLTDRPLITSRSAADMGSFFCRGQAGMNFDGGDQQQILIRAPASKIDGLMGELGRAAGAPRDITLLVESLPVRGLDNVRAMFSQSREPETAMTQAGNAGAKGGRPAPSEPPGESTFLDLLEELFGAQFDRLAVAPDLEESHKAAPETDLREATPPSSARKEKRRARSRTVHALRGRDGSTDADEAQPSEPREPTRDGRLTLVERRLRALEKASASESKKGLPHKREADAVTGGAEPTPATARGAKVAVPSDHVTVGAREDSHTNSVAAQPLVTEPAEHLITLVIQVLIGEPELAAPPPVKVKRDPRPPRKPDPRKTSSDSAKK